MLNFRAYLFGRNSFIQLTQKAYKLFDKCQNVLKICWLLKRSNIDTLRKIQVSRIFSTQFEKIIKKKKSKILKPLLLPFVWRLSPQLLQNLQQKDWQKKKKIKKWLFRFPLWIQNAFGKDVTLENRSRSSGGKVVPGKSNGEFSYIIFPNKSSVPWIWKINATV